MSDTQVAAPIVVQGSSGPPLDSQITSELPVDYRPYLPETPKWANAEGNLFTSSITSPDPDDPGNLGGQSSLSCGPSCGPASSGDINSVKQDVDPMSLSELVYLRRLQKYHKWKRSQAEQRAQVSRTSWAVRGRLIQGRRRLLCELSKALRSEDQSCFLPLFQAFHTVETACEEYDRTESSLSFDRLSAKDSTSEAFLLSLPQASRDVLLQFISRIASDPDFLIRHLSCLANKDFDALLRSHSSSESCTIRSSGPARTSSAYHPHPWPLDTFLDLGRHDFLSLVLQITGPNHSRSPCPRSTHYWAKICAFLLSNQKPGADRFVVAVLNSWPTFEVQLSPHPLETWLLKVLRDGQFLLEKPDKYSFRMRAQCKDGTSMEDTGSVDAFFAQSMNDLLDLLKDTSMIEAIPKSAMKLGQAIVHQLRGSPKQAQAAPYFLCTRWLFSSYLTNLIRNPESCGLLLSYHISASARRRILDELALRLQKLAFDVAYTWKHSAPIDSKLLDNMQAVVALFRPQGDDSILTSLEQDTDTTNESTETMDMAVLCPTDFITLVHGLFPPSMANLELSVLSLGGSTVRSSASSVSGFSMFKTHMSHNASGLDDEVATKLASDTDSIHMSASEIHTPNQTLGDRNDCLTSEIEESAMIADVKAICADLAVSCGSKVAAGHEDPFCEPWASLPIRVSSLSPVAQEIRSSEGSHNIIHDESKLGTQGVPDQIKEAMHSLLDHLDDTKRGPRSTLNKGRNLHISRGVTDTGHNQSTPNTILRALATASLHYSKKGLFAKAHSFDLTRIWIEKSLRHDPAGGKLACVMNELSQALLESIDLDKSATESLDIEADEFTMDLDTQLSYIQSMDDIVSRLREKMWYISNVRFTGQYEDLLRVTSALKTMGLPSKPTSAKGQPPLRHRATGTTLYEGLALKSESAILELLAAAPAHGGPNKLSDKQVKLTTDWLQYHGFENICKAEERLHRFCHEVSKCVESVVGDSAVEHPVLWSSELFGDLHKSSRQDHDHLARTGPADSARERLKELCDPQQHTRHPLHWSPGHAAMHSPASFGSPNKLGSETGFTMFERAPLGYSGSCSPTLTNSTSNTLWSSSTSGEPTMSSITSLPSRPLSQPLSDRSSHASLGDRENYKDLIEELKANVTSLLLSDIGHLFSSGSETDLALWETFGGKFAKAVSIPEVDNTEHSDFRSQDRPVDPTASEPIKPEIEPVCDDGDHLLYDSANSFRQLMHNFQITPSPHDKLKILHHIQEIYQGSLAMKKMELGDAGVIEDASMPETMAQADTVHFPRMDGLTKASNDALVACFRRLFQNSATRPSTLFRDLQYIAVLVPATHLDSSDEGHAFWNATIAALCVKQDILRSMIETADAIVAYHTLRRGHSFVSSAAQAERDAATFTSSRPNSAAASDNVSQYSMTDAGQLYLIAAKEGDPVAQRELATLYLTHPEIMKRVVAPMTKVGDVFKGAAAAAATATAGADVSKGGRRGSGYGAADKQQQSDHSKYDPVAMAVARHWMELAAKGGDELAKNTLKVTDEIERIS